MRGIFATAVVLLPSFAYGGGSIQAGRFEVIWSGPNDPDIELVAEYFAEADRDFDSLLGYGAAPRINAVVSRSHSEFLFDTEEPGAAGVTFVDGVPWVEIRPPAYLKMRGLLREVVRHEAAHAMLGRAPRWFTEGLAVHLSDGCARFRTSLRLYESTDAITRALVGLPHSGALASGREQQSAYAAADVEVEKMTDTQIRDAITAARKSQKR